MRDALRGYTGVDLMTLSKKKIEPIIEGFLFESDYVMVVAPPKVGKSLFVQQMACSLSSGQPFLETFEIPHAVNVWYFATEGKDDATKDRFIRMSHSIPIDFSKLFLFCSAGLRLNTPLGAKLLAQVEEKWGALYPPKVIIIDALYRAIKGSVKDDDIVNEFHQVIGELADRYGAAVIIVHHMKKPVWTEGGGRRERSDDDTYGSVFLTASVDQLYWLEKCEKNPKDIVLKCDTQRSGEAIDNLRLSLLEPDPLYYKITSMYQDEMHRIVSVLKSHKQGLPVDKVVKATSLGRSTVYLCFKELIDLGEVEKTSGKPVLYKIYGGHTC